MITTQSSRRSACLVVAAAVAPALLLSASPAAADASDGLPPVLPTTTVWSADGTAAANASQHDGAWFDASDQYSPDYGGSYGEGFTGRAGDWSFDFGGPTGRYIQTGWDPAAEIGTGGTGPFALSFRMRTTQEGVYGLASAARLSCNNAGDGWFDVRGEDGKVFFEVGGTSYAYARSSVVVNDGTWHTVEARRDDAGIHLTVDGRTTSMATPDGPSPFRQTYDPGWITMLLAWSPCISQDRTTWYQGLLDDVRVGRLDMVAPELTAPSAVSVDATGPAGGPATWSAGATDVFDPAPSVTCDPASGSSFAIGTTTVTCTATDSSGNSATASFPVTVRGAAAQAGSLVSAVTALDHGSLAVKARQALASMDHGSVDSARGQLGALVNSTTAAVRTGRMSAADGQAVITAANRIIAVLG